MARKKRTGPPDKFNKDLKREFLKRLKLNGGAIMKTLDDLDVSEASLSRAKKKDDKFKDRIAETKKKCKNKSIEFFHSKVEQSRKMLIKEALNPKKSGMSHKDRIAATKEVSDWLEKRETRVKETKLNKDGTKQTTKKKRMSA